MIIKLEHRLFLVRFTLPGVAIRKKMLLLKFTAVKKLTQLYSEIKLQQNVSTSPKTICYTVLL
jgi:hypothetical protein